MKTALYFRFKYVCVSVRVRVCVTSLTCNYFVRLNNIHIIQDIVLYDVRI